MLAAASGSTNARDVQLAGWRVIRDPDSNSQRFLTYKAGRNARPMYLCPAAADQPDGSKLYLHHNPGGWDLWTVQRIETTQRVMLQAHAGARQQLLAFDDGVLFVEIRI